MANYANADTSYTYTTVDTLSPFRFWCQKVLPAVYDDSLSYYELLCKVVDIVNNMLGNINEIGENSNQLHQAFLQLQTFVNDFKDYTAGQLNMQDAEIASFEQQVDASIQEFEDATNDAIREFQNSVNNTIAQHKSDVASEIAEFENTVNTAIEQHKSDVADKLSEQDSDIEQFKTTTDAEIAEFESTVNSAIAQHKVDVEDKLSEQDSDIERFKSATDSEIAEFESSVNQTLSTYQSNIDSKVETLETDIDTFENATTTILNSKLSEINDRQAEIDESITSFISEQEGKLANIKEIKSMTFTTNVNETGSYYSYNVTSLMPVSYIPLAFNIKGYVGLSVSDGFSDMMYFDQTFTNTNIVFDISTTRKNLSGFVIACDNNAQFAFSIPVNSETSDSSDEYVILKGIHYEEKTAINQILGKYTYTMYYYEL